ncbi:hypothetical protein C2G38_2151875 [Gigaspora rosea]|uniref:Uncharacterized protein n=1 Tax=Gigaspora rosea TaxID=44941 RepID=A0A397W984_9GLOM|nr:hypothetical protein C2G38_2151875 [Gigaspora rosea]
MDNNASNNSSNNTSNNSSNNTSNNLPPNNIICSYKPSHNTYNSDLLDLSIRTIKSLQEIIQPLFFHNEFRTCHASCSIEHYNESCPQAVHGYL